MFRTVVVGADDSPTAAKAVDTAIDLVALSGGTLHVVSAYKPVSRSTAGVPAEFHGSIQPDSGVRSVLDDLTARARARGVTVEAHDQRGEPAQAVLDVAERVSADVIVTGSQGMQRRVLSSIPNTVAHQAACAVLIVKTD
jgi:nucleotide-binding universal stress UspA family protein